MKTTNTTRLDYPPNTATPPGIAHWEGRTFGAVVLAAFLLYGIGSANIDTTVGLILVVLNSAAVVGAGVIGFRLMRPVVPQIGFGYLLTRILEGVLLGAGVVLIRFADSQATGDAAYLLAMLALGIGSVPFCHALGDQNWLSQRMALWGMASYAALATGAFFELVSGRAVAIAFAAPGGLFELALGIHLLRRGFGQRIETVTS